jgi:hypothetical protein
MVLDVADKRSLAGGRWLLIMSLLAWLALGGLSGCVLGDGTDTTTEGVASPAEADGGVGEPTEGGAGELPEPAPSTGPGEPPAGKPDGGAGGPGEPLPRELTPEERSACTHVPATDDVAVAALDDGLPSDTESATEAARSIADLLAAAAHRVERSVSALPEGDVRDAAVGYQAAQEAASASLRSGGPSPVADIARAERALTAACGDG